VQARQPPLQTRRFDRREGHPVHARRARIYAGQRISVAKNVFSMNLVVEQVAERVVKMTTDHLARDEAI